MLVTLCVAAVVFAQPSAPAFAHGAPGGGDLVVRLPLDIGDGASGVTSARPHSPQEARDADRASPPGALVHSAFVSATAQLADAQVPMVVAQSALPWRFFVGERLAQRFGERAVHDAVRQWDGVPGSRWATHYAGLAPDADASDGQSTVFLKDDCPADAAGFAYWRTDRATGDSRYGNAAVYLDEVDVAVCSSVRDAGALRRTIAHEIGHVLGLHHLCDPGESCWRPAMGTASHRCRVMYIAASSCGEGVTGVEHLGPVHLYPALARLAGPTRVDTAARASYAFTARGSAGQVILARADQSAHGPLAAAALSGAVAVPFLLASPDPHDCLNAAGAEELGRVSAYNAQALLIGAWPQRCLEKLAAWGVAARQITGGDGVSLSLSIADELARSGRMGNAAFLVAAAADAYGHVPDGVAAGAAAGTIRAPVLYSGGTRLNERVRDWLRGHPTIRRLYVLGGTAVLSEAVLADARALGLQAVRVAGPDRVATALTLSRHPDVFAAGRPVLVAAAGSWADAVTASALGGRLHGPVLVTPPRVHADVLAWLQQQSPPSGYVVGGQGVVPYDVQWRYAQALG